MLCPKCHHIGTKVIDSRQSEDGQTIRRRRSCEACGFRFTTFERMEKTPLIVIKRSGIREPFNRQKLLNGLIRSAEKRPVPLASLEAVVEDVEQTLRQEGDSEVQSEQIGELVMDHLAKIDDISYIRFASVYRQFTDRKMFMQELARMEEGNKDAKGTSISTEDRHSN
ncbi:transcriptional repressor NrdR [Atopobacter sp. AH10]|uniref:transcriptional regulator NrdR n=1 Tax=Atopobacter sp. AH10 TaxID=2315861 RepID=UPI000EF1952D|nr:transcriptional regulator NrdR [Atopobacter sp. AH10]RLK64127.1 transcriptional repressor NrdR [Atopobacter sp. AH10]